MADEPTNCMIVGVAQLDDGRFVACVTRKVNGVEEEPIRLGYTKAEVDNIIAALQRCKKHLP